MKKTPRRKEAHGLPRSPDSVRRTRAASLPSTVSIAASDDISVATDDTASKTKSRGLPAAVVKSLLKDIEDRTFGGLERLKSKEPSEGHILSSLLDKRKEIDDDLLYGR